MSRTIRISAGQVEVRAELNDSDAQRRAHVAVDRVTGGATEGFLFENDVLCGSKRVRFRVFLRVERPTEEEARWLAASLRALDRGLIRVGSSKAGGRLALATTPAATGPYKELFTTLEPSELNHA